MDWIKVLTKHIIYEYRDLRDSEFAAWIKIMALTAHLEHMPNHKQMLAVAHYKTIESLERKLNTRSIDLQYVLNKVFIDAQYVSNRREQSKINTQRYRAKNKPVINDVMITSCRREEKRREYNIIHSGLSETPALKVEEKPKKRVFVKPLFEEIKTYCLERKNQINPQTFIDHYSSNGWMVGKNKMKDWKAAVRTWEASRGGNDGRGRTYEGSRTSYSQTRRGKDDSPRGIGIPLEYKPEKHPTISEEERQRNLERLKPLTGE